MQLQKSTFFNTVFENLIVGSFSSRSRILAGKSDNKDEESYSVREGDNSYPVSVYQVK